MNNPGRLRAKSVRSLRMFKLGLAGVALTLALLGNNFAVLKRISNNSNNSNSTITTRSNDISLKSETDIYDISYSQVQEPDPYTKTHAIFLISFGKEAAQSTLVERCVLSLRRRGQWTGHIILLTDAPPDRYENGWDELNNVTVMHPNEEHYNGADGKPLSFNRKTMSLKVKRFKTFVLHYIELDERLSDIEVVYYFDIDIIAGGDLKHLFRGVESEQQWNKHQVRGGGGGKSTILFFTPISSEYPFQSGTFVVGRHSSKHCLELWRREIEHIAGGSLGMDQAALRNINQQIEAGNETKCSLKRLENKDFLSFPRNKNFERISQSRSYTTLLHLSNSKFAKWIDKEKQNAFLYSLLQLSGEEIQSGKYGKSVIKFTE